MDRNLEEIMLNISDYFVFDLSPIAFSIGPRPVHYYGLFFALGLLLGIFQWKKSITDRGYTDDQAYSFVNWAVVAIVIGARLGHCLFYQPGYYFSNPIEILYFFNGGLASHGAAFGMALTVYLYAKKRKMKLADVADSVAMAIPLVVSGVRIGNFFNSEIVGTVWNGAWAVRFPIYTTGLAKEWVRTNGQGLPFSPLSLPRHPAQIYEFLFTGLFVYLTLLLVSKTYKNKLRPGLISGLFLILYFGSRFFVEFFKETQTNYKLFINSNTQTISIIGDNVITMGQKLSIPFIIAGVIIIFCSYRAKLAKTSRKKNA